MLASKLQIDCKCQLINPDLFDQEANKPQVVWFYRRTRQISWAERRYHRYDLTLGGKNCFGKMLPKKIKIFMDTLLRLLQKDFYIMNIITSIKTSHEMAPFSSYLLIIWSTVYFNAQLVQDKWIWVLEAVKWKLRSQCRLTSWSSRNTYKSCYIKNYIYTFFF